MSFDQYSPNWFDIGRDAKPKTMEEWHQLDRQKADEAKAKGGAQATRNAVATTLAEQAA